MAPENGANKDTADELEHEIQNDENDDEILHRYHRVVALETAAASSPAREELLSSSQIVRNYVWLAILFSANHSCTLSCISLATARLGAVGAWQGGIFFLSYTASSLLGATYVVKRMGSRDALQLGMWVFAAYVGSFVVVELYPLFETVGVVVGAILGGIGRGLLVMAQGSYFGSVAADYSFKTSKPLEDATSYLGGIFAGIFLGLEVLVRLAPTILVFYVNLSWTGLFVVYTALSVLSAIALRSVHEYSTTPVTESIRSPRKSKPEMVSTDITWDKKRRLIDEYEMAEQGGTSDTFKTEDDNVGNSETVWRKATAAIRLLQEDAKMKYLICLNGVFGFCAAFINSFVNGSMIQARTMEGDGQPVFALVGFLMSIVAGTAALCSVFFGKAAQWWGKGPILILGAVAFFMVAFPFLIEPDFLSWTWRGLAAIYAFYGIGRATFEGTLRATFADYFPHEKEGAFGNIVLQHGLSSAVGCFLSAHVHCKAGSSLSPFCVEFVNGSWHNVLPLECAIMASAVLAILGYWRASCLRAAELSTLEEKETFEMASIAGKSMGAQVSPRRPTP